MRLGNNIFKPMALAVVAMFFVVTPLVRTIVAQQDKAEQAFVRARELFDEENWGAAAAKFEEFLALYPQDKKVPAAYYWLAMTLKKQTKYAEADERLVRLLNEFPNSSWVNDARALRVEIAGLTHNEAMIVQATTDENESVKLAALQSLLRLDPQTALNLIADVLRPSSKESLDMKMSVVTLLGRGGGNAAVPLLSQVVNNETVTRLRVSAIWALARIDDPNVFEVLKAASSSEDKQVAEAALFAIGQLPGERPRAFVSELARSPNSSAGARHQSILLLGQQEAAPAADELIQIYDAAADVATREQTILALGLSRHPRAQAKLWEIAQQPDGNLELRRRAILALGQRGEFQALEKLIQLYDQDKDEQIKRLTILALAPSNEKIVTRKFMAIAKNDPSSGLRELAVMFLRRSSDPEVKKFLQEIDRTGKEQGQ